MEHQDWTTVTFRRRIKKSTIQAPNTEKNRMAKLADIDCPGPKKCINPISLQSLIKSRIELKVTQENADNMCAFPRNTFKDIESHRLIPNEDQKHRILQNFSIQLKIVTIRA